MGIKGRAVLPQPKPRADNKSLTIRVDDEIARLLRLEAKPFESRNAVLRRLLRLEVTDGKQTTTEPMGIPTAPSGTIHRRQGIGQ